MTKPIANIEEKYTKLIDELSSMSEEEYIDYVAHMFDRLEEVFTSDEELSFITKNISMINEDRMLANRNKELKGKGVRLVRVMDEDDDGKPIMRVTMEKLS